MFRILIAEDDLDTQQLFAHVLSKNGYHVKTASTGREALQVLNEEYCDLVISDVMMPGMDGYELIQSIRAANIHIPILIITAKSSFNDIREGFISGTDDYMVKPINVNEMVLRVQALLRRAKIASERQLAFGSTILDCDSLTVISGGDSVMLPQKEFMLLFKMMSFPGRVFTRQQIMDDIWGYRNESDMHTIDVHIGRLRDKFRDNPDFRIVTIRGLGYKIEKKSQHQ